MRGKRTRVVIAMFALALAAAACGNDDDNDTTAATTVAGDTKSPATDAPEPSGPFDNLEKIDPPDPCVNDPGVTDTEIKVGVIAPETGPQALSFQPSEIGMKARIDKANADGEFGTRKVTLVTRDDMGDQTRNAEVARDLVESENVFAIIEASSAAAGSGDYLHEKGIPVTGWHVGVPTWSLNENMFTFRQGTADDPEHEYTTRNADVLKKLGGTKVALIGGQNAQSALFIKRVHEALDHVGGFEVVYENVSAPVDQRDFTAESQRIKEAGADSLVTGMDLVQNAAISDALAKDGVVLKAVIFPGGYDPRVLTLPGMEGAVFGIEFKPFELETEAFKAFDAALPADTPRGQVPFIGWLSAEMLVQGIKDAGVECPTREAFINNLRMQDAYTGGGAFDPVDLSEGFGEEFRCVYYVKVVDAKFVPQFGGEAQCGEPFTF